MYGVLINPRVLAFSTFCVLIFPIPGGFSFVFVVLPPTPLSNTSFSFSRCVCVQSLSTQRGKLSPILRTNSASTRTPIRKQGTPEVLQFLPKGFLDTKSYPGSTHWVVLVPGRCFLGLCVCFLLLFIQPAMFRVHVCSLDLGFRRES